MNCSATLSVSPQMPDNVFLDSSMRRATFALHSENNTSTFLIRADDTSALRAGINSVLRTMLIWEQVNSGI